MSGSQGIIVKAYLDTQEIRRFLLETGVATNFEYVKQKAHHIFQIPQEERLRFSWKDADNEFIALSSDEELVEALNHIKDGIFRLHITRHSNSFAGSTIVHSNVVCDGCQGEVRGTRYKCAVCPDYDLCSKCEMAGKHQEHNMMCVRRPVNPCDWGYWRDFSAHMNSQMPTGGPTPPPPPPPGPHMGRPPYHHGFYGSGPWGGYPWQCRKMWKKAYKCHQKLQRENSRVRETGTYGCSGPKDNEEKEKNEAPTPQPNQPKWGETHKDFLKSMGEAVQSMLDPFGIDVSFSVDQGAEASAASQPTENSEKASENKEKGEEVLDVDSDKKEIRKSPQGMNVDLDSVPSSPDAQRTAEFIVIDADEVEEHTTQPPPPPSQKVIHSLELMKRMGFKDQDGWLTKMLTEHNGNIDKVLDIIQSKCRA